jgi:hypothetical protein
MLPNTPLDIRFCGSNVSEADIQSKNNIDYFTDTQIRMRAVNRFSSRMLIFVCLLVMGHTAHAEEKLTIVAAADLKFALDEIVALIA